MPLPTENVTWPPPETKRIYAQVREWSAWWSGDIGKISSVYGGGDSKTGETIPKRNSFFWARRGKASNPSGSLTKLHIPMASSLATFSSDLLFAEEPSFSAASDVEVDGDDETVEEVEDPTQVRLDQIIAEGGLYNTFIEAAERCAALGGVYLHPVWDQSISELPFLHAVDPDNAVPEWSWGRLSAVTFWEVVQGEVDEFEKNRTTASKIWRHLERHEVRNGQAWVMHALYVGTTDKLGAQVELTQHPSTASLIPDGEDLDGVRFDGKTFEFPVPGVKTLDVRYIPNMRPNRKDRGSPSGRSDFSGIEPAMDALDETYTSWMRDIRLGQARLVLPKQFLENAGRGKGASFDIDSEVFTPLDIDPSDADKAGITPVEFKLRTEEHAETAKALVERIVDGAGYSPQSAGVNIEGTAHSGTALKLREKKTFATQGKKRRYWGPPLEDELEMLLAIDVELNRSAITVVRPVIEWPDTTREDQSVLSETVDKLKRAQSASTEVRVRIIHPDWSDTDVQEEVDRIMDEEGIGVELPNPETFGGIDAPTAGMEVEDAQDDEVEVDDVP